VEFILIDASEVARKTLALAALAAGMLAGTMGTAAAQYYDPGYRDYPLSRDYDGPRPYYRGYQREGYYRPGRYRTWNGCQPGWTVQDGLCKPYRGY
jgi:hypothetical protein